MSGVGLNRLRKTRGLQRLWLWNFFFLGWGGEFHGSNLMMMMMIMMMMVMVMVNIRCRSSERENKD